MSELIHTIMTDGSTNLYSDLWNAITDMLEKDGIDYMNEIGVIRVGQNKESTTLFYKDKPYCCWTTDPKIEFGLSDQTTTTIRMEILLKKL